MPERKYSCKFILGQRSRCAGDLAGFPGDVAQRLTRGMTAEHLDGVRPEAWPPAILVDAAPWSPALEVTPTAAGNDAAAVTVERTAPRADTPHRGSKRGSKRKRR